MSEALTEKQEAVLNFIEEYQMNFGKSPTIREMKENFGVSSDNSILKHLKALKEKGFIEKDDTPRGIKLLSSIKEKLSGAMNSIKLPVLGSIPAGGAVLSEEHISSWMSVGEDIASNATDYFMLEVTGNSMVDAGIFEGDMVVVDMKKQPKNGDVVVAMVDGGNTLKRFIKEGNNVYLKAENKDYNDIYPENELSVQGVVSSLIRQY
jgi:repressor LexA